MKSGRAVCHMGGGVGAVAHGYLVWVRKIIVMSRISQLSQVITPTIKFGLAFRVIIDLKKRVSQCTSRNLSKENPANRR